MERIETALRQLEAYNRKLDEEATARSKLGVALRAYRAGIQEASKATRSCVKVRPIPTHVVIFIIIIAIIVVFTRICFS